MKKHCCLKNKRSFPLPKPDPGTLHHQGGSSQKDHSRRHQLSKGLGPARCLAAGDASPSGRRLTHWLLIGSDTHSRFPTHPTPASIPARLLSLLPLRECPHTQAPSLLAEAVSLLAEAARSRDPCRLLVGRGPERLPCLGPASRKNYVPNAFLEPGLA